MAWTGLLCADMPLRNYSLTNIIFSAVLCRLCWRLYAVICTIHSWNVCLSPKLRKFNKKPYFGGSRLSTSTPLKSSLLVLVMASSMFVTICNHFHANGAITFLGKCPSFFPSFTQRHESLSWNTRLLSYHTVKTQSLLSHLVLERYRGMNRWHLCSTCVLRWRDIMIPLRQFVNYVTEPTLSEFDYLVAN